MVKKLLIIGHAQHGKDTLAELLGVKYASSSQAALDIFLFDQINHLRGNMGMEPYKTKVEAFEDRHQHRDMWHILISDYNKNDRARLAKKIMENNDCYVGMRCELELAECLRIGLFDEVIWVDASQRKPLEPETSMGISFNSTTMTYVNNNGTEQDLQFNAGWLEQ